MTRVSGPKYKNEKKWLKVGLAAATVLGGVTLVKATSVQADSALGSNQADPVTTLTDFGANRTQAQVDSIIQQSNSAVLWLTFQDTAVGDTYNVYDANQNFVTTATANGDRAFAVSLPETTFPPESTFYVAKVNADGSVGTMQAEKAPSIATQPAIPTMTIDMSTNGTTGTATLSGTVDGGALLNFYDPSTGNRYQVQADSNGNWHLNLTKVTPGQVFYAYQYNGISSSLTTAVTLPQAAATPMAVGQNDDYALTVAGSATANATVTVKNEAGAVIGTTTADASGDYSVDVTNKVDQGAQVSVTQTVSGATSNTVQATIPTLSLAAPTANGANNHGTLTVAGTAKANAQVTIKNAAGQTVATTTADANGAYSVDVTAKATAGDTVSVTQTVKGHESAAATTTLPTIIPAAPTATGYNNDGNLTVSGTGLPGATVEVKAANGTILGTVTAGGDGSYQLNVTGQIAQGATVQVTQTVDGETSPAAAATIPYYTPAAPTAVGHNDRNTKLTVSGQAEAGATVNVVNQAGTTLGTTLAATDGSYVVDVTGQAAEDTDVFVTQTVDGQTSEATKAHLPLYTPAAPTATAKNDDYALTVTGMADGGATVTVTDATGHQLGQTVAAADGAYTMDVTAQAAQGDTVNVTQTVGGVISAATPTTIPTLTLAAPTATGANTDYRLTVTGEAKPNATVTATVNGQSVIGSANAAGDYTLDVTDIASQGDTVSVIQTFKDHVSAATTTTLPVIVPDAPTAAGHNDQYVLTVTGTGVAGATIVVKKSGITLARSTAGADGHYVVDVTTGAVQGDTLQIAQIVVGQISADTTATLPVIVPAAPTAKGNNAQGQLTVTGVAEPGATISITKDGQQIATGTADAAGNYVIDVTAVADPGETVTVSQTVAGQTSATVATTLPAVIPATQPSVQPATKPVVKPVATPKAKTAAPVKQETLPQTGDEKAASLSLVGLLLMAVASFTALFTGKIKPRA